MAHDPFAMVLEFHRKFGAPIPSEPGFPSDDRVQLRWRLVHEEYKELFDAIIAGDFVETADAIADLMYVLNGMALEFGFDLRPVFAEVHRANMLKEGGATREDGKILKPPGWQPPDIAGVLRGVDGC